jgi:hypothetical protein
MKTRMLFASLIALGMGTASLLRTGRHNQSFIASQAVAQTTSAAFRDGLYLGRLAAERGAESHIASGRWATPEDRAAFTAGYQHGYSMFPASAAFTTRPRSAD